MTPHPPLVPGLRPVPPARPRRGERGRWTTTAVDRRSELSPRRAREHVRRSCGRWRAPAGPQTLAELRAALALASPGEPAAFDARLNGTRVTELPAVVAEYQRLLALRAGPEARAVIAALLTGRGAVEP